MFSVLLAAALVFSPADAKLSFETASQLVEQHTPRDAGTPRGHLAARFLYDRVNATGLDGSLDSFSEMTPKGVRTFVNVESTYVSDPEAPWIVLLSHFDTKPGTSCPGANDGASTAGLLVGLGNSLFDQRPKGFNVLLIWTDGEECMQAYGPQDGFWGSRHAAQKLKASGRKVLAVLCLDMLGDRELTISVPRNGSPWLRNRILASEAAPVKSLDAAVKDDHVPFLEAGFAAADIIDFDYGSAPGRNDYWHTAEDTIERISETSLLTAGRLVMSVLDSISR